jgi:hypothetical protein
MSVSLFARELQSSSASCAGDYEPQHERTVVLFCFLTILLIEELQLGTQALQYLLRSQRSKSPQKLCSTEENSKQAR